MPYKDKQKQRAYQRDWVKKKRLGLPTRKQRKLLSKEEKRRRRIQRGIRYREKLRRERDKVFGMKCWICGSIINLCLHRKDGVPHRRNTISMLQAIRNPQEWVRLCYGCHKAVHWCMKYFRMLWQEILKKMA